MLDLARQQRPLRDPHLVVALLPAHNEAAAIAYAINSLRTQSRPPDVVMVVADNCSDSTGGLSILHGVTVFHTEGNTARKAGALNQVLRQLLPQLGDDDLVLIMDADSQLNTDWIRNAEACLLESRHTGAVCGVYRGIGGGGLLAQLQRNEYVRAVRGIGRRRGVKVLSGCGTIFRARALWTVAASRGKVLPGRAGDCFDEASITEDYEMTLALRSLGFDAACSTNSIASTELMPTWKDLFRQRVRWQRGGLSDLRSHGFTQVTWRDWIGQGASYLSFGTMAVCWSATTWSLIRGAAYDPRWGLAVTTVTLAERVWTARRAGLWGILLATLVVPEMCYGFYKIGYLWWAAVAELSNRKATWNHVGQKAD